MTGKKKDKNRDKPEAGDEEKEDDGGNGDKAKAKDKKKESGGGETCICITCDRTFEAEEGRKPRCPICMSIHSVEPYKRKGAIIKKQNARLIAIIAVLVVAAAAAYLLMEFKYKKAGPAGDTKYGMSHEQLVAQLTAKGISAEAIIDPFQSGEDFKAFVEKAAAGASRKQKGEKLYNAFLDFKNKGAYTAFVPRQPRQKEPMKAGQVLASIRGSEKTPLYSLELATMFAVAARLLGMHAAIVKVDDYKDLKAPLDPSGNAGHFAAAVFENDSFQGKAVLYDLHGARVQPGEAATFTVLDDIQVVASYFGHQAFHLSGVKFDSTAALARIEDAISLFPSSAELHSLKGLIYIASGGVEEGKQQIRKAMTIQKDAQRILKWGAILMAEGEEEEALVEIRKAIDLKQNYAMAHATLAMALLASGESDEARKELDLAAELDPQDPLIPLYEANYYLERGQVTQALEFAEKAFERSYGDPQVGIMLASLYGKTGKMSKMAKVLDQILNNENIPDELKTSIKDKFDYDPGDLDLDEEGEDGEEEDEDGLALGLGGIEPKGGLLSSPGKGLGKGLGKLDDEDDEDDEELEGEDQFKLQMGSSKGGLLTGKGSGLDLEMH
ncbi:MAG: tetratricopeptide repeat protein [Pseudomonadota bacterium]